MAAVLRIKLLHQMLAVFLFKTVAVAVYILSKRIIVRAIAQGRRIDGRKSALPYRALIRERVMAVTRERHGVGVAGKSLRRRAVIAPPRPRTYASIFRM